MSGGAVYAIDSLGRRARHACAGLLLEILATPLRSHHKKCII